MTFGCMSVLACVFFFKQKTAYEMRISDWSSDVCSSDLFPWLRHVFADGGYAGDKLREALRKIGKSKWTIEIIKRSDTAKVFEVLPRRWVVERTFAWLSRNRRLAKDFAQPIASATAWLFIAPIQLFTRSAEHTSELLSLMLISSAVF